MANTYTQIYIHIIFAVRNRQPLIKSENSEELNKYITGIISNKGQKLLSINSISDHVHIIIGMKPNINLSDLVRDIKNNSSKFINSRGWIPGKFNWQEGYGAFSYGQSQLNVVINYIKNQKKHHVKRSYREEYLEFLNKYRINYNEKYLKN
jgi:REP element-mobilizing transposase RayT